MRFLSSNLRSRAQTRASTASARALGFACLMLFAACESSSAGKDGGDDEDAETRSDSGEPTGADDAGGNHRPVRFVAKSLEDSGQQRRIIVDRTGPIDRVRHAAEFRQDRSEAFARRRCQRGQRGLRARQ